MSQKKFPYWGLAIVIVALGAATALVTLATKTPEIVEKGGKGAGDGVATVVVAVGEELRKCAGAAWNAIVSLTDEKAQVTSNVLTLREGAVCKLTLYEKDQEIIYELVSEKMGSDKRYKIRPVYRVGLGFNLEHQSGDEKFKVVFDSENQTYNIHLSDVQVISAELLRNQVVEAEDGWWNKITEKDRNDALMVAKQKAKNQSLHTLKGDVRAKIEEKFTDIISTAFSGYKKPNVVFHYYK